MQQKLMKQYEYKISIFLGLTLFVMFGLMAFYGMSNAMNNDKSLTVRRSIELSSDMATYFWWGSSLIFLVLSILGLMVIIKSFQAPSIILLNDYEITAPKRPISTKMITVKYHEITKYEVSGTGNMRQLRLNTPYGKIVIPAMNFIDKSKFNEMLHIISQHINI